jgi:hypothetical protein
MTLTVSLKICTQSERFGASRVSTEVVSFMLAADMVVQVACTVENTVAVATLKRLVGCMTVFDIRCNKG